MEGPTCPRFYVKYPVNTRHQEPQPVELKVYHPEITQQPTCAELGQSAPGHLPKLPPCPSTASSVPPVSPPPPILCYMKS